MWSWWNCHCEHFTAHKGSRSFPSYQYCSILSCWRVFFFPNKRLNMLEEAQRKHSFLFKQLAHGFLLLKGSCFGFFWDPAAAGGDLSHTGLFMTFQKQCRLSTTCEETAHGVHWAVNAKNICLLPKKCKITSECDTEKNQDLIWIEDYLNMLCFCVLKWNYNKR